MAVFSVTEAMVSWLSSLGYSASTRVPANAQGRFVTVTRVGGQAESYVDRAEMAVQCWGADKHDDAGAEELANAVRNALVMSPRPSGIHSARVETGPYEFYDDSTGRARYQLLLAVSCQLEI